MKTSPETKDLYGAMHRVQIAMPVMVKDETNSFFKSKYAPLNTIWKTLLPLLAAEGLLVIQSTENLFEPEGAGDLLGAYSSKAMGVCTRVVHVESGQWQESTLYLPLDKVTPQAAGSAITYARRYNLVATFCLVADDDDDGERAMNRNGETKPTAKKVVKKRVGTVPQGDDDSGYDFRPIGVDAARGYADRWGKMGVTDDTVQAFLESDFEGLRVAKLSNAQVLVLDKMLLSERKINSGESSSRHLLGDDIDTSVKVDNSKGRL